MTRREFLAVAALLAANPRACVAEGRLAARPGPASVEIEPGEHRLGLGKGRDGLLYVPKAHAADKPAPLLLMLHGAGGRGRISDTLRPLADEFGVAVLAPDSRGVTWDVVLGEVNGDDTFVDAALTFAFARWSADPSRLAVAGFSDGATYALRLGTINGDLFSHVIAFSPGFLASGSTHGWPRILISHGTRDKILPIEGTSRRLVPQLKRAGYDVTYKEFDGPHTVPPEIAREAIAWLVH